MLVTVSAELPIDARAYVLERDGAAFRSYMCEEMRLLEYEITACWQEGGAAEGAAPVTRIHLASKPDVSAWVPETLAGRVGEEFGYIDEVCYDPRRLREPPYELLIRSHAPFLGDKGRFSSRTVVEPVGPGRCRHTLEQRIEIKGLLGLGAVAKRLAKKSLEDTFNRMPAIIEGWMRLREELLQTPHGRERLLAGRPRVEGVEWMEEHADAVRQHGQRRHSRPKKQRSGKAAPAGDQGVQAGAPAPPPSAFAAEAGAAPVAEGEGTDGVAAAAAEHPKGNPGPPRRLSTKFYTPPASPQGSAAVELPAVAGAQAVSGGGGGGGGGEASGDSRPASSADSYSADQSSAAEEGERVDWAKCEPWRVYWRQHGVRPHPSQPLPPELVRRFVPGKRPRPVQVERLGAGASRGGALARLKAALGSCIGKRSVATH